MSTTAATGALVLYFRLATLPLADAQLFFTKDAGGARLFEWQFNQATSQLSASIAGSTETPAQQALVAATWYRLEASMDVSGTTYSVTWALAAADGALAAATTDSRIGLTASLIDSMVLGTDNSFGPTTLFDVSFDDLALSDTSADYPIGPTTIRGYSPSAVGTHNLDAATSQFFSKRVSAVDTALTTTETTSYQTIDDVPLNADSDSILVGPAFNTISFVGQNAAVGTTPTCPTRVAGDLIVAFAYRSGSATAPSLAAGYTDLGTSTVAGGSARSVRMAYRIATNTAADNAAFTNASDVVVLLYRNAAAPATTDITFTQGTTQAQTYGAKTISDTAHSWAAGFIGVSLTAVGNSAVAPAGMTNRGSAGTAPSVGGHDTNAIRGTNWASTNVTGTGAGNWITAVIEIKATTTQPTATWYAEYDFANEASLVPKAVRAVLATDQGTATASTLVAKLFDSLHGTNVEDIANLSVSATGRTYREKLFAQRPNTGGVWTLAAFNALRLRFGLTAAASGTPRLEAAILEAMFPFSSGTTRTPRSAAIDFADPALV